MELTLPFLGTVFANSGGGRSGVKKNEYRVIEVIRSKGNEHLDCAAADNINENLHSP